MLVNTPKSCEAETTKTGIKYAKISHIWLHNDVDAHHNHSRNQNQFDCNFNFKPINRSNENKSSTGRKAVCQQYKLRTIVQNVAYLPQKSTIIHFTMIKSDGSSS